MSRLTAMTPLERVAAALRHEEPDRIPVYPLLNGVSRKLVGADYRAWATDAAITALAYERVTHELGLDVVVTLTDLSVEAADFGQIVLYPKDEAAYPDPAHRVLTGIADYAKVAPIDPRQSPRMSTHIELCERLSTSMGRTHPIVAFVFGPLGILSMMRGQAEMYVDLIDDPDAVHAALRALTDTLGEYVDALLDTGVHAIMFDTLYGSQSILSKAMWLEMEGPYVRALSERVHARGAMVMIHNCGNGIYFDAHIDTMRPEGISFLHMPADCRDGAELKARYGERTALIGHVDPTWVVRAADDDEIRAECRRQIDLYRSGGGFILATGCEYPANADLRAARIMIEEARTYGRYGA